jgi:hypothetical protein
MLNNVPKMIKVVGYQGFVIFIPCRKKEGTDNSQRKHGSDYTWNPK